MPQLGPNPTLKDIQDYVTAMEQERGFKARTVTQQCLMLGEEVGELFKSVRKSHAGMNYATKGYDADPAGEITDILIFLASIANRLGIDLEAAFRDKEAKNHQRKWK
jgi:NTP pyrophosphatase (non-canonical NTP hydrolase)